MLKWFSNLSAMVKLTISFGIIVVALVFSFVSVSIEFNKIKQDFNFDSSVKQLKSNLSAQRVDMLTLTVLPNLGLKQSYLDEIKKLTEDNQKILDALKAKVPKELVQKISDISLARKEFNNVRDNNIIPFIIQGKNDEAIKILIGEHYKRYQDISRLSSEISSESNDLVDHQIYVSKLIFSFSILFVIILSVVSVYVLSRNISNPLKKLSKISDSIAAGDLTVKFDSYERDDEIGRLKKSLSLMVDNIKKLTKEIMTSVAVLSTSASDVSTSSTNLVSSSSEMATAVSQTTSTIEEVKQTAKSSSKKAKLIMESAKKAAEVAQIGKGATEQNALEINRIGDQMNVIAKNMQRLSEQSQMISEILTMVDDLSQQSNLLAVNAAIEAAKAGEQGKGFSVVAQEIKILSEQSKQATNQVRTILNDIQKSTSSAVLATEQGIKVVDVGRQKSSEAGDSIDVLTSSVNQTSDEMAQIAMISHQQLIGIEQASTAMENIKEVTTQNLESTRQLESSAQSLKKLGDRMKDLVSWYRV